MRNPMLLKTTLLRNLLAAVVLCSAVVTSGCAGMVVAAAAGAGALSYVQGSVNKTYHADYYQAVRASKSVLDELNIPLTGQTSDALKTVIKAKRADDTPVTIQIDRDQPRLTRISVRTGVVGVTDRKASEQIHRFIGRHLKPATAAQTSAAGTNSAGGTNGQPAPVSKKQAPIEDGIPASKKQAPLEDEAPASLQSPLYIYYGPDDEGIPSEAIAILERVTQYMQANPSARLRIRGYTDATGNRDYNLEISRKRALAIQAHFIAQGIEAERISAEGLGARDFIASNKTAKLRALNRRVELELY